MKRFNLLKEHIEKKDMWLYNNDTKLFYGKCGTPTGFKDKYGDVEYRDEFIVHIE